MDQQLSPVHNYFTWFHDDDDDAFQIATRQSLKFFKLKTHVFCLSRVSSEVLKEEII